MAEARREFRLAAGAERRLKLLEDRVRHLEAQLAALTGTSAKATGGRR
jgi:hypothetical protein